MSGGCCGGKPCGGKPCGNYVGAGSDVQTRYPQAKPDVSQWRQAPNAAPQFETYGKTYSCADPPPYTYTGESLAACDFPLGGFGTGYTILHGDGTLQGYIIQNQTRQENQPMNDMPACFFGISAKPAGSATAQSFVLASPETYTEANCALPQNRPSHVTAASVKRLQALPGIKGLTLVGKYPIADVSYDIEGFPVQVSMEAMNPMIPLELKDSAIPCNIFTFTFKNAGTAAVDVRLMEAQQNFVGWDGQADCNQAEKTATFWGSNTNTPFTAAAGSATVEGIFMSSSGVGAGDPRYGTLSVAAVRTAAGDGGGGDASAAASTSVIAGAASEEELWGTFAFGEDVPIASAKATAPSAKGTSWAGGVVQSVSVPAGGTASVTFVLSWCFANRTTAGSCGAAYETIIPCGKNMGNRYATWFATAKDVLEYTASKLGYLQAKTRLYRDTIFGSAVPWQLLDSAAGRAAIMRSPTMWWTADGIVLGCEGNDCCPLNCTHVYGYTTLIERLYPEAAKDMRLSDFVRTYDPAGGGNIMRFGTGGWAIDGALANIIKTYLVVQQADPEVSWLPTVWPNVKAQMQAIQAKFDTGTDGCLRGAQQNTYDTSMQGANTFIGSYYVTALQATAAMATLMGEPELAKSLMARRELSIASYEKICWNESFGYYTADVTAKDCANSYGPGCFVDQLCAAGLSSACGFGYCFTKDGSRNPHEASARHQIASNNVVTKPPWNDFQHHLFDGDQGITVCVYPHGKLGNGMMYDTLVSTGFTSPVVAGLVLDRNMPDALKVAGIIRRKQDGRHRSPWNEPECNVLYSRQMAHWNMFDQCCGFRYDSTAGAVGFDPRFDASAPTSADFNCFVTLAGGWGEFAQQGGAGLPSGKASLTCLHGSFRLKSLSLASSATTATATAGGSSVALKAARAMVKGVATLVITFDSEVQLFAPATTAGGSTTEAQAQAQTLTVTVGSARASWLWPFAST